MTRILLVESRDDLAEAVLQLGWGDEFSLDTCRSGQEALAYLRERPVDLLLVGNQLAEQTGVEFVARLRSLEEYRELLVVMVSDETDYRRRAAEIASGVDDYISWPTDPLEILTRIRQLLREAERLQAGDGGGAQGFSGDLSEVNLVDLLQMMQLGGKTGAIRLWRNQQEGEVWLRSGEIVAAAAGSFSGEHALHRMATWTEGHFRVAFGPVEQEHQLTRKTADLLEECADLLQEWQKLADKFPNLGIVFAPKPEVPLEEIPEKCRGILQLLDGRRSLRKLLQVSPVDDIQTLHCIWEFHTKGWLDEVLPDLDGDLMPRKESQPAAPPVRSSDLAFIVEDLIQNLTRQPRPSDRLKRDYPNPETGWEGEEIYRAAPILTRADLQYLKRKLL